MYSWVGQGTCDSGDLIGSQPSIIYLATSFGQTFSNNGSTPGTHYVCTACIGSGLGSFVGFNVVHTSGTENDDASIFVELTKAQTQSLVVLSTSDGNRCGAFVTKELYFSGGDVYFAGWKIDPTS